jgi:hypothetical protein
MVKVNLKMTKELPLQLKDVLQVVSLMATFNPNLQQLANLFACID